ncbi:hypothetical protein KVK87_02305 [Helicobacter pylori]|nr:hypothetical protein KVK87_02305 [Helicobacter pylori]
MNSNNSLNSSLSFLKKL